MNTSLLVIFIFFRGKKQHQSQKHEIWKHENFMVFLVFWPFRVFLIKILSFSSQAGMAIFLHPDCPDWEAFIASFIMILLTDNVYPVNPIQAGGRCCKAAGLFFPEFSIRGWLTNKKSVINSLRRFQPLLKKISSAIDSLLQHPAGCHR